MGRQRRRAPPHGQRQQRHADATHQAQRHVGGPPAVVGDAPLRQRRPQRAGDVIATGADGHGDAASPVPPQAGVGHQRREGGGPAQQAQQAVRQTEQPHVARQRRQQVTGADRRRAQPQHARDAPAVGPQAGPQAAQPQADHHQGVGQRGAGAADAEFGLHRRQHHRHHVHGAVAQRHQQHHHQQAPGGGARVDQAGVGRRGGGGHGCLRGQPKRQM